MRMPQQQIDDPLDAHQHMIRAAPQYTPTLLQVRLPHDVCSAVSQVVFCPDGANLFVGGELAPISLREGFLKRSFVGGIQLNHGLILARQLQENTGEFVLHLGGQARTVSTACSSNLVMGQ
jgi:hypothetical protein